MFRFEGFEGTKFAKDMARVADQLNETRPALAAEWMAERQRWIRDQDQEVVLERLGYDAFELSACLSQLATWEQQAKQAAGLLA